MGSQAQIDIRQQTTIFRRQKFEFRLMSGELDRVPREPRQICQLAELHRPLSTLAVGNHEICKDRVRQQRHMAKNVVEDIRLLEIVQLLLGADEDTSRKASVGEMVEEHVVGHESGHRNNPSQFI